MRIPVARILSHLAAGLTISIGVAWGSAWLAPSRSDRANLYAHDIRPDVAPTPAPWYAVGNAHGWQSGFVTDILRSDELAPEHRLRDVRRKPDQQYVQQFGWPFRAMQCEFLLSGGDPFTVGAGWSYALAFPDWLPTIRGGRPYRVVPLRPIWSGLVADTATFASVSLALLVSIRLAVRWRRSRLRRCTDCSHRLLPGQIGCPECGGPASGVLGQTVSG